MRLEALQSTIVSDFRKHDSVSKKEDTKSDNIAKKFDKASLSSESKTAGDVAATVKVLSARIAAEPDIRLDKVEQVKEKIESGYYNTEEFAENLADRLIRDFDF